MDLANLTWTGNHFLDEEVIRSLVRREAQSVPFTMRGSADSTPLREALGRHHGVPPEWLYVGAGSSQILDALIRSFAGCRIVDVVPNFHLVQSAASRFGCSYLALPIRAPKSFRDDCQLREPAVLAFSSPRNPFGYSFRRADVESVLASFPGPVIADQAYAEFGSSDLVPLVARHENLIVVRTLSKAWGLANLRIGYALSRTLPAHFREDFLLPYNVGELAQRVACALLEDPRPIMESIEATRQARARFLRRLRSLEGLWVWPSEANFVCIEHPRATDIADALGRRGIAVTLLQTLRNYPAAWPQGLRVSVCPEPIEDHVIEVLTLI